MIDGMRPELERLLAEAKAKIAAMTLAELDELFRQQRRSYVIAEAMMGSDADEAAYRKAIEDNDVVAISQLDWEAADRGEKAARWLDENGH